MVVSGSLLKRLPISTAMLYLAAGYGLGPAGLGVMAPDPFQDTVLLEHLAEITVLISLFATGLKLGLPLAHPHWRLLVRLAFVVMALTVGLIAVAGIWGLGLSPGAAVLLGAILAPTDPVLASEVQVEDLHDRDRLRFSLTGEGSLNDGAAFPFVMLGLGLLGLHDLGAAGWRWWLLDGVWPIGGGLGALIGKCVIYLRTRHKEAVGLDEFLALGLIALTYGMAHFAHTYGFLAVFAAGLALQRVQEHTKVVRLPAKTVLDFTEEDLATDHRHASAYMRQAVQGFNEQLERIRRTHRSPGNGRFVASHSGAGCSGLVDSAVTPGLAATGGERRLAGIADVASTAASDRVVWDSRYWCAVLPDVCHPSRVAPTLGGRFGRYHPRHRGGVHRGSWPLGDADDASLWPPSPVAFWRLGGSSTFCQ